eukprot:TRINITY_DN229_c0_g2_i1.p1 TRINITY_DN229_c0_g2~~TRINITY_DN229_c0_g2_i1.p1  ORF type:complete len:543 (-),score=78.04 TRINITY_DN229_c0_g2_i1:296-1924(-)
MTETHTFVSTRRRSEFDIAGRARRFLHWPQPTPRVSAMCVWAAARRLAHVCIQHVDSAAPFGPTRCGYVESRRVHAYTRQRAHVVHVHSDTRAPLRAVACVLCVLFCCALHACARRSSSCHRQLPLPVLCSPETMAGALHVGAPSASGAHTAATTHKKVFVGGLSWETDEQSLRDYFAQYGSVSDCVIMRDRSTGHPRGFGFVTYDDQLVAERVAAEFHELDGRQVEAKIAVPRSECVPPSRNNAWRATKKVFIGGLPATCREPELKAHFIRFGDIAECQVMYDHQTGNSRGFGFVTFTSELTVDKVVDIDHHIMQKHVEVKRAEPKQALEARRGREAAGATLSFSSAQPSSTLHVSPQMQHNHLSHTSQTLQPHLASATSIPYASFPTAMPNAASLSMARSPPAQAPFQPFSLWSGVFSSGAGSSWNTVQTSSAFVAAQVNDVPLRSSHSVATGATSISPPSTSVPLSQSSPRATPSGMGFFTPAQPYSPDLAQCAYDAFYSPSAPLTSFASDLASVIPSTRTERRFHPYSTRERIERSYR